jgi:hypothetical protein
MLYCMVHNIEKIMNCAMAWWGWIVDYEDNMLKVKSWDKNIDTRYLKNVRLQKFEFWRVRWIFKNDFSDNLSTYLKFWSICDIGKKRKFLQIKTNIIKIAIGNIVLV